MGSCSGIDWINKIEKITRQYIINIILYKLWNNYFMYILIIIILSLFIWIVFENINTNRNSKTRLLDIKNRISYMENYLEHSQIATMKKRFIAIDVETTGLKAAECSIIQISIIIFEDLLPKKKFVSYINPGISIPESATKVNKITKNMVKDAPRFGQIAPIILNSVTNNYVVGHNLRFDSVFIERELERVGYKGVKIKWGACTMTDEMARPRDMNKRAPNYIKLSKLSEQFNIKPEGDLHDAYVDAMLCGKIAAKRIELKISSMVSEIENLKNIYN